MACLRTYFLYLRFFVNLAVVDGRRGSLYSSHTVPINQKASDIGARIVASGIRGVLGHHNGSKIDVRVQDAFTVLWQLRNQSASVGPVYDSMTTTHVV